MKKFFLGIVAVLGLLILGISLIPLFYTVDDLRPEVKKQIEAKVRGKVELGALSLSTFPSLKVTVGASKFLAPAPYDQSDFVAFESAEVAIPLWSLLFSPHLEFTLKSPKIALLSRTPTESNLTAFLPEPTTEAAAADGSAAAAQSGAEADPLAAMPGFLKDRVLKATVTVTLKGAELRKAELSAKPGQGVALSGLDLSLSNIGMNSPMGLQMATQVSYKEGDVSVVGPISVSGEVQVKSDGKHHDVAFVVENKLSDLEIAVGTLFHKKAGVNFLVSAKGNAKKAEQLSAEVSDLKFSFGGLNLQSTVKVERVGEESSPLEFKLNSEVVALAGLADLVPMAKSYGLTGGVSFAAAASGTVQSPILDLKIMLKDVAGKTPQLALPIEKLNGTIAVAGTTKDPVVNIEPFALKVGTSDLDVKLLLKGIERPNVKLSVTANRFNVDELLGTQSSAEAQKTGGSAGTGTGSESAPQAASTEPLDESLDKMAPELDKALANPMLDKVVADVKILAKSMRMVGGEFRNARLNLGYKARQLTLSNTGIDGYKGSFVMDGGFHLVPKVTGFNLKSALTGISIGEALKVHAPTWKDEVSGALNGSFLISGKGLTKSQIEKNLRGSLKGNVANGRLSIPVVKMISGILQKLPKKVQDPAEKKADGRVFNGEFKTMRLDSEIVGRQIQLKDLDVIFAAQDAGLGELRFKGNGVANFDRQVDFTGVAFVDPKVLPVPELKGPSGQVELPMKFKGNMSDPKTDVGYSVGILGPRMAKAFVKSEAGQKLQDKIKEEAKKLNIPADLKKKFGF